MKTPHIRLAAVDIGTNSFHMIIVEMKPDMSFQTIDRAKDMIRIGDGSITTKMLSKDAMEAGIASLVKFKKLALLKGVEPQNIVATATSAVREAKNGGEFIDMAEASVGIRINVISGEEEARLIYIAARQAIHIGNRNALIIDIGGGSVEFIVANAHKAVMLKSLKIGVARMREKFITKDPPSLKEIHAMQAYVTKQLRPVAAKVRKLGFTLAIGSSGTIENIAEMISVQENNRLIEKLNNYKFTRTQFNKLLNKVLQLSAAQRKAIKGLDAKRADIIVSGLLVMDTIMQSFKLDDITLSQYALREGIVIDHLTKHSKEFKLLSDVPDVRRRNVLQLGRRCLWEEPHITHVAKLALKIFDDLKPLHNLTAKEREYLEYGAMLHDVGCFISQSSHHKHSYYLITNGEMKGFTPEEIQIIANIARYHRKSMPKPEHPNFHFLSLQNKRLVSILAGIVRIADGLDRTHRQSVQAVSCRVSRGNIDVKIKTVFEPEIEIWGAERKKDLLENVLDCKVKITAAK
jgi:exopolyphosphatase/guanosine-5'-triphosphate,3'-diphosphate pyrophosphatase